VKAARRSAGYERPWAIVNAMPLSMVLTDREVRLLYASPPWIEARGLEASGHRQDPVRAAPDMFEQWRERIAHCMKGNTPFASTPADPAGRRRQGWVKVELAPWYDHEGAVGGLIITSYDITHIVEALERIERSGGAAALALEIADLYVYEMDYVRRELIKVGDEAAFFDPSTPTTIWRRTSGAPSTRATCRRCRPVGAPRARRRALPAGVPGRPRRRPGVWTSGTAKLIRDENGRPVRLVGALRNITARKAPTGAWCRPRRRPRPPTAPRAPSWPR
jgi:PAS domain-containing protein